MSVTGSQTQSCTLAAQRPLGKRHRSRGVTSVFSSKETFPRQKLGDKSSLSRKKTKLDKKGNMLKGRQLYYKMWSARMIN